MFPHSRLRIPLSACASALLLAASAAAQPPVTVSFRALDESGQPVRDLTPAEVAIKVDGKPREVRSLQLVGGEAKPSGPVPARAAFGSNTELGGGRDVILVLDDESLARGKEAPVQVALRQIVGKLNPSDRVGVLSLRASGTSIGATADRAVIDKAITDLQGQARTSESLPDLQCRTGQILQTVKALLASAADAKTTFVIVSTGMAPVPNEQMRTTLGRSSGLCNLRSSDFSEVGDAAKASPAAVYVLFAVDGSNSPSAETAAGLESLAGVTSAPVIRLTGTNAPQIDRIASETAVHYVASFNVEPGERTGSAHKTEIRVTRAGVKTLAGSAMVLAKPGGKSPKDMLASSDAFRDLPLRATGWAMREPGSKVKVIALFEPAEPGVKMASAVIALIDGNRIRAQWTAQSAELERVPVVAALLAPPGNYRLRVAATDASGRGGAVDYPLQGQLVPLGPVTMSGLALGVPDNGFKPRVLFGPDDQGVMGYLELYGVPKGAQVTAAIELAPSEDAPAIGTTGATVQPASADDMRIVVGGFSITGLQPGDWVMRFVISMDGKVIGTASRTLRKAAK